MSGRNGEKARFNIQRKKRLLRRKNNRELQKTLESNPTTINKEVQGKDETAIETTENEGEVNS